MKPRFRLRSRPGRTPSWASALLFGSAAIGIVQFYHPPHGLFAPRLGALLSDSGGPNVAASPNAFGRSGQVKIRFALPGADVEYPLEVGGNPSELTYAWAPVRGATLVDSAALDTPHALSGSMVVAPKQPGFYRLALLRGTEKQFVDGITLAVMVPFAQKLRGAINGYRIGTYLAERVGGLRERPEGFVEVAEDEMELPLTKHLRIADFITHDQQSSWPRYAALDGRLLDKLELVFQEVARWHGGEDRVDLGLDVHSGFRTPVHNRRVRRSARDSRHQYGDAADIAIDANGDGRVTASDAKLVGLAVDIVEREHPELTGGLGVYTNNGSPYVHIDARGKKARWRG